MEIAGVDGCPGGWVIARAQAGTSLRLLDVRVVETFADVLDRTKGCAAVGIDVPIGLSDDDRREADAEARRVLRPVRHSSVFPAPVRRVLGVADYREACAVSARVHEDGKKISKQTFYLAQRIHEVDRLMTPELQQRVVEVHPEVCFWALNGRTPVPSAKRTAEGELHRTELLAGVLADGAPALETPSGADRDDLLDACAASWSAWRFATRRHGTLPKRPPRDARGLRMEIVY